MPRPSRGRSAAWLAAGLLAAAALTPADLADAVAAAGALVFEAAPFVMAGALLARFRFTRNLSLLACGCGGSLPSALAPAAVALAWIGFGPCIALLRTGAALAVAAAGASPATVVPSTAGALRQLGSLAVAAASASLGTELLRAHAAQTHALPATVLIVLAAAVTGAISPCAVASVAVAIALRTISPPAAYAILATAGIVSGNSLRNAAGWSLSRLRGAGGPTASKDPCGPASANRRHQAPAPDRSQERAVLVALAIACALLALRGTHGLLHPRLTFVAPLGALLAAALALRSSATRTPVGCDSPARLARTAWFAPLLALAALVFSAAPPSAEALAVPLALYPGERVDFVGRVARDGSGASRVERLAITCCRADARALAVELERPVRLSAGAWVSLRGTALLRDQRIVIRDADLRLVPAPADPFIYL